jgi:hypothetical protein
MDGAGNIYVASCTQSLIRIRCNEKFPITAGAFQTNFGGGIQDGVLLKFDPKCLHFYFPVLSGQLLMMQLTYYQ